MEKTSEKSMKRTNLLLLVSLILAACGPEYPPWVWRHPLFEGQQAQDQFKIDEAACRREIDWVETSPIFFGGLARDYNEIKEREQRECLKERGWVLENK